MLLQSNVSVVLDLDGLSVLFLGQTLPHQSDLLSTILSDLSLSGSVGFMGLQPDINFADKMSGKAM
jgi:hypothetical protein